MADTLCEILHAEKENDNNYLTDCVYATCSKCGDETIAGEILRQALSDV